MRLGLELRRLEEWLLDGRLTSSMPMLEWFALGRPVYRHMIEIEIEKKLNIFGSS